MLARVAQRLLEVLAITRPPGKELGGEEQDGGRKVVVAKVSAELILTMTTTNHVQSARVR